MTLYRKYSIVMQAPLLQYQATRQNTENIMKPEIMVTWRHGSTILGIRIAQIASRRGMM